MLRNQLKTIVLLGALSAGLIAIGGMIGPAMMWIMVGLAVVMNVGAYYFSDRLVLRMHNARPLSPTDHPALHGMLSELSRRANIPVPKLYLIDDAQPNAFATGRNPAHGAVAVTTGILGLLSTRELRGVIAHELAHIKNRDILVATVAAAVASAITSIANVLSWTAILGGGSSDDEDSQGSFVSGLLLAIVAPMGATLIQLGISRSREYMADAEGARLCDDPEALARALEKLARQTETIPVAREGVPATASLFIVSPLAGSRGLLSLFSTHPPVGERVRRLRALAPQGRTNLRPMIEGGF
jgi:heat shock protein HtpX